ncbi:hypothetical protein QS257_09570 [Terrilactibacillus sp. S3-3]|nr:hypothetical protein QS257_09570 [Terrilactibacillus sp. S3-3]
MRAEWRSSSAIGDNAGEASKGNCQVGNDRAALRENLLDLSRNVYFPNDHLAYILYGG